MNPPSAIQGAMSRDRKPFTYTPGGLDLSEIKSERMAKRLMRNAMNEGVPELPRQQIQSPPTTTIAVPNFNCLPVQVFPAFNLPANPKSLLRTRSNPVAREPPFQREAPLPQFVNNKANDAAQYDTFSKNTPPFSQTNNNRPSSMYEYGTPGNTHAFMNYGNGNNECNAKFPEISYDAQYFQVPKISNYVDQTEQPQSNFENIYKPIEINSKIYEIIGKNKEIDKAPALENKDTAINIVPEIVTSVPETIMPIPEGVGYKDEQKEVKIVKKEVKSESNTEKLNGNQNGDTEAAMTVTLPTKKSAAKTETKVEISKKSLPDGSIEEVKKTITKTTTDGKTEIKTKTETTIIPKNDPEEEEEEVEEEEEEESGEVVVQDLDVEKTVDEESATIIKKTEEPLTQNSIQENGNDNIIKTEERSETTTTSTKNVVVVHDDDEAEEEFIEKTEAEEAEPDKDVIKRAVTPQKTEQNVKKTENKEKVAAKEEEISEEVEEIKKIVEPEDEEEEEEVIQTVEKSAPKGEEEENVEEKDEYEEAEEKELEIKSTKEPEDAKVEQKPEDEASEYEEEDVEPEKEQVTEKPAEKIIPNIEDSKVHAEEPAQAAVEVEIPIQRESESDEKQEVIVEKQEEVKQVVIEETLTPKTQKPVTPEVKEPLREPSVPLEKVEDVEIKPIGAGNFITKSHTETTEIITGTSDKPTGVLTEYNRTENIVTVNRTTKTLDYENSQQTIPTLSYFTPHIEKLPPAPQPSRPYQPVYPSEPTSERRHSLLLERLSMERQIPTSEIFQNTQQYNQSIEQQKQFSDEPRVEILNIENVKPSSITNQQWYQQTKKDDVAYNNVAPVAPPVAPSWTQPKPPTPQQQPTYQPPQQPAYQAPQPVYQPPQPKPVYQPQPQYQSSPVQQYQSYTENTHNSSSQQNTYSTYTPKPTNWAPNSTLDPPTINTHSQYNYKDTSNSYQTQRPSSYVPPPWEQDSNYVVDNSQNYYQPPQQTTVSDLNQSWKTSNANKFTKTTPTAYIPPKPNQSFVKHVTIAEPPKQPGRKTYYSEYERRYISVPESTYIPGETKPQQTQHQPDPSPAYYYDNNEPTETVEHQWRKELREFTEKAQTIPAESVKPPWEMESKTQYAKTQETYTTTPTPTWSQTLRPQSWRERSFESDFMSQEWPKTNTLGRGRPLSSYGKETIPERTRGVSVDRYNPNNYQAPVAEHPPVQTFTHNPPAPHSTGYHNPNVPAYHARASAEPREQPVYQQPRAWRESRASPFQSRSFKYLQWITGTEDL